ncbi:MAG: UDP-3-O-[3-hydroxymyristoyl] N-acetylglucosamine deacetylase [Hyphomicrobiaceae bacterium]|jgi:UDP-3-O-[3-hydroxymyristoyl] N-acetylglucosamine deacetylase
MNDTILLVDDDAAVRETISAVLGDEGFRVFTAVDGNEALASLEQSVPDLVLLDVWLPETDGIEVLARIRETHQTLPVIVISGHGNVDTAVRATKLGAADFIEKPFSIDALLAAINRALDRGQGVGGGGSSDAVQPAQGTRSPAGPRVPQRTVGHSVVGGGLGLHSGVRTGLILQPLPPGSGIRFASVGRTTEIDACVSNVDSTGYATTLYKDGTVARTVEHLMAALHAYGITNLLVKIEGEVPILDGSAVELCRLLDNAGVVDQDADIAAFVITEEVRHESGDDQFLAVRPYDGLRVIYELSYPEPVGDQTYVFEMKGPESFREEIAPARTFGFVEEIRALEDAGLGQGGQLSNFILIGEKGIVNTELRFPEELARHKILDILGDFYLLGAPLRGEIHARKTGHSGNIAMVRALSAMADA